MSWPNDSGTVSTSMQGTTLVATDDHSLWHRTAGSELNNLNIVFGTTGGTNLLQKALTVGDQLLALNSGGTAYQVITKGTLNNCVLGTPTLQAPTLTGQGTNSGTISGGMFGTATLQGGILAGQIQNNGTIANGVYGTATYRGGTANNLTLGTPALTGGTINNSRIITPYQARAYLGTTMGTVANNTEFKVTLDTKDYDSGTNFDLANNRFVAPVSGFYIATGITSFPDGQGASSGRWATELRKNGTNMQFNIAHLSNANGISAQATGIFNLNVNDYIELWAYNLTGTNTGVAAGSIYTSLAVHLLSQ